MVIVIVGFDFNILINKTLKHLKKVVNTLLITKIFLK
jgi:hypothetical protein